MGKTMAEHLMEQGEQRGMQKGEVLNQRRALLARLRHKFPKMPARVVQRIEATEQLDLLQAWFDQALTAKKLGDLSIPAE